MIIEYIPTEVENINKMFFLKKNYDRHLVISSNSSVIFLFTFPYEPALATYLTVK